MAKLAKMLVAVVVAVVMYSCTTSKVVLSYGADLSKYSCVVFGEETTGDGGLEDVIMCVRNEIAKTKLRVVSGEDALVRIALGEHVLSPKINVLTEKWDGGHTYITITFYDYATNQSVAVVKSSGIGLTVSHDQDIAVTAIGNKLREIFGSY
jgi:hypothetical protein